MDQAVLQQIAGALNTLNDRVNHLIGGLIDERRRVYALEASELLDRAGRSPRLGLEFRSQYGEDMLLWDLLGVGRGLFGTSKTPSGQSGRALGAEGEARVPAGVYVECGAGDGRLYSVSWIFEAIGWTGLLVEGVPEACEACRTRRPGSVVEHAAVGRRGVRGETTFSVASGGEQLSFLTTTPQHRARVERETAGVREVRVPTAPLGEMLTTHGFVPGGAVRRVDFVVLDVEGGEPDALDGLDLDRTKPRVLVIEDNEPGGEDARRVGEIAAGAGYIEVARLWVNRVFVHQDEQEVLDRARELRV